MKLFQSFVLAVLTILTANAAMALSPTLDLEKKIAYQQGQFGALYDHCGTQDDKIVIGGSLAAWREETFRGYLGSAEEMAQLAQAFSQAADEVVKDTASCQDWIAQGAATWQSIVRLSQYGTPFVLSDARK